MLIPSIDLLDGKAVQLEQGNPERKKVEVEDVFGLLDEFSLYGEVAVIDLNAALGRGDNRALIFELLKRYPCRIGGGIRDYDTARAMLSAGAKKIILGTAIGEDFVNELPRERIIAAIDAKGDEWVTHGWQSGSQCRVLDVLPELQSRCGEFLYTQVQSEGLMQGIDEVRVRGVIAASDVPVTVAGGITTAEDVNMLNRLGANSQVGMAIYTGKLTLNDAFIGCVDFAKSELIPTVVQDADTDKMLMLAYSNRDSLLQALETRRGVYWSRSRQSFWAKGETSGHIQTLVNVDVDCDGDTILFRVKQAGSACHFDRYSCFASQTPDFGLDTLDKTLTARQNAPTEAKSFTQQLFADVDLQAEKLREECEELIDAETFDEVRWEAADVIFFALVMAKAKGVRVKDIIHELSARAS